eukprot:3803267-Prorocentrum_lima.AAC.1
MVPVLWPHLLHRDVLVVFGRILHLDGFHHQRHRLLQRACARFCVLGNPGTGEYVPQLVCHRLLASCLLALNVDLPSAN